MKQPTTTAGAWTPDRRAGAEPVTLQKRIGSTTYQVNVYFSQTSTETLDDKVLRLIRNDAMRGKAAGQ